MLPAKVIEAFDACRKITTDTRKIAPGAIFFALRGDNFDGNSFAAKALELGAAFVVVDRPEVVASDDARYLLVDDSLLCLQELGRHYRRQFDIPVIGITGSNGKTTTKELIHAVLSTERRVHYTQGNLNNHIGVPLTLLAMPEDTEIAVIEMGANKPGDIQELVDIAEPTFGLITNVGKAHLERMIDLDGVQYTKGALFRFLRAHDGHAFVNLHDPRVAAEGADIARVSTYGSPEADFYISQLDPATDHLSLQIFAKATQTAYPFESHLIGPHNAENILAAVAVGITLGISLSSVMAGIAAYVPTLNRTEIVKGDGVTVLLDAYNANPSSMEATLRGLAGQPYGRMALVLGDMFELGVDSATHHAKLLELARRLFPDAQLIGIGKELHAAMQGQPGKAYPTVEAASADIKADLAGYDFVLLKGSRGMALERLLDPLGLKRQAPSAH
jgi:UDP-N-acetylmuramoyl-tripeptide--D-alanyl-D-alanine ligase